MDLAKRKSLMKAFSASQFNFCPLIWIFHSRQLNNRINKKHEKAVRLVDKDNSENQKIQLLYTSETFRYFQ